MRFVIARFPFDFSKDEVIAKLEGVKPEPLTAGASVIIGRRTYPVKQVGEVITRQDRRDFSAGEVIRAMTALGFTCRTGEETVAPAQAAPSSVETASAMLGGPAGPVAVPLEEQQF